MTSKTSDSDNIKNSDVENDTLQVNKQRWHKKSVAGVSGINYSDGKYITVTSKTSDSDNIKNQWRRKWHTTGQQAKVT